ncbi:MAG: hypothetical protein GW748_05800 [Alphaproteobacteria bacterium]|nr:hypothetical protein [Alphaproteobacteria bacterium]NCQ67240.1 hypothetical protein [Alphaproteobacteria bacterium]NCT07083.1 hypothetical protein [Alphaproteobacteria bacterium]
MALTSTPQAQLLFEKMRHTQARQENTSDNLARSGVAGEKTKEIEPFSQALKHNSATASIKTTNAHHLSGSVKDVGFKIKKSKEQAEPTLTGNSISPEEQLLQLNEAATDFYRLQQVHKSEIERIKTVLNMGGGK